MADCTVSDVITGAQSLLGDAAGEITQEIIDDFGTAYGEMMAALLKLQAQEVQREVYFTLPAYTNVVFPSSLGVTDFAEPQQIWERGTVSQLPLDPTQSITDGTPLTLTFQNAVPWSIGSTGTRIELNAITGVPDWVNRDWFITVTGPKTATLNGSISILGASGAGGNAMTSAEGWIPMVNQDVFPSTGQIGGDAGTTGQILGSWRWTDNAIYVPGALLPRQLWIEYTADQTPPASGIIGVCQGRELNFLKMATAAHFAPKRQLPQGPQFTAWAYGPSGEADGTGGFLRTLLAPIWLQRQQLQRRSGLFRRRRNNAPLIAASSN